jgi:hypothetical protein
MTAVGGPEVLEVADVPESDVVDAHDVLVRLRAAGINPVDYKLRFGGTIGGTLPGVLGWDGAGVVDRVGPEITRFRTGDEVYFCDGGFGPTPGMYQETKVLNEAYLARNRAGCRSSRRPRRLSSRSRHGRRSSSERGSAKDSACSSRPALVASAICRCRSRGSPAPT